MRSPIQSRAEQLLIRAACFVFAFALIGCKGESKMTQSPPAKPNFAAIVDEVFFIKPPVDRVILVVTISEGTVKVGDSLTVRCRGGHVMVVVESIEKIKIGEVQSAGKGDQVGLKLRDIRKDQPERGDRVVGNEI
jgi:translation elongation factor EF-1alpha